MLNGTDVGRVCLRNKEAATALGLAIGFSAGNFDLGIAQLMHFTGVVVLANRAMHCDMEARSSTPSPACLN